MREFPISRSPRLAPGSSRNPTRSARRASDPRTDRADRTVEQIGGLVVAQPEHLGGDERRPPIVVELGEQVVELGDLTRHRQCRGFVGEAPLEPASAPPPPGRVDADPPGDREDPVAGRTIGPVPVQRSDRPLERLLGEVVGGVRIAEIPTHLPHVALGLGDEALQSSVVAVTRGDEELRQVIHGNSQSGAAGQSAGTVSPPRSTMTSMGTSMECLSARELISAAVDDELPAAELQLLDEHLEGCPLCRGYAERVSALTRVVRLRGVEALPDLTPRVLDRARPPGSAAAAGCDRRWRGWRW